MVNDYERATAALQEALTILQELGDLWNRAEALDMLGYIARIQGHYSQATALFMETMQIYEQAGDELSRANTLRELGVIGVHQGNYERAARYFAECLYTVEQLGDTRNIVTTHACLALLEAVQGQPEHAARRLGMASGLLEVKHLHLMPLERADFDQWVAVVRVHLDEQDFEAAWEAGRSSMMLPVASGSTTMHTTSSAATNQGNRHGLTRREMDVLRLVADGLTDAQIAEQLVISPRTASSHLSSIYSKLGVASRTAATRFAIEHHLL
jgi:DNA-binding NarL/FixJ family response regulator